MAAILAAVLACCPVASLAGLILGAWSLHRINRSGGILRGRAAALTAMALSTVLGTVSFLTSSVFNSAGRAALLADVGAGVNQLIEGKMDPSAWWVGVDAAELLDFQQRVHRELGPMKVATATPVDSTLGLRQGMTVRLMLEGESQTRFASVDVIVMTNVTTWMPTARITSFEVDAGVASEQTGADAVTLRFPAAAPDGAPDTLPD